MKPYVILLRGINVGGKNKLPMQLLRKHLEETGFSNISTYIASGNVILESALSPAQIKTKIEQSLIKGFTLDSELIKVLVLSKAELQAIIDQKPPKFGEEPEKYLADVIYLIDVSAQEVFPIFSPRPGVDQVWQGQSVIYSQRLSSERTKSRLNKIMSSKMYKSMTIRTWNTTIQLLNILEEKYS